MRYLLPCFMSLLLSGSLYGQEINQPGDQRLKLIVMVPVEFGIGYENTFSKRFSADVSAGILTKPNSTIIINTMESLGVDQEVSLMIQDAFETGYIFKAGSNYNFKRSYLGLYMQHMFLVGKNTPEDLISEVMGVDMTSYPRYNRRPNQNESIVTLKSYLFQLGLTYGYRIFVNEKWELDLEASFSANVASKSSISSDYRNYSALSDDVNVYLQGIYHAYAYVPSIGVILCRKF